jgi:hypothetical protein
MERMSACTIVGGDEACYILAGYLHATYSLKSSCTVGCSRSSAEALAAVVDILVAELRPTVEVVQRIRGR